MKFSTGFTMIVLAQWTLCSIAFGQAPRADTKPKPQNAADITDAEPKNNDDARVKAALEGIIGEDYRSLVARGNLLLLADRPDEAMKVFERAYAVADQKALVSASEDIARAIKAQDGTIGRANAWVLSLRPTKQEE